MNDNFLGLIVSYGFFIFVYLTSTFLYKFNILKDEGSRKYIHIISAHWWIIAIVYFNSLWIAIIPPISFILLNYLSHRYNLVKAMERDHIDDFGSVNYPISLLILTILTFTQMIAPYVGAIGVFVMGYADGLAALVGKTIGETKLYKEKTIEGSLTMFIISFIVTLFILLLFNTNQIFLASFTIAILATILELFSPKGVDNLTVPIASSIVYHFLFIT